MKSNYSFTNDKCMEFPRMVITEISYACNARCIHCIYNQFPKTKKKGIETSPYMSESIFKNVVEECALYPHTLLRIVGFGEPMLHPKFIDMVAIAKKRRCNVGIITNGSLLDEKMANKLLNAEVDAVDISVDAFSKQTYENIRKGLDFDKLIVNVKRLVTLRDKMKKNTFVLCSIVEQKEVMPELSEALAFWGEIADKVISRKFLTFGLFADDKGRVPYYTKRIPCFLLYDRINIDIGGEIRLCGYDSCGETYFGNIESNTIYDAWHSKELNRIREYHQEGMFQKTGICKDCHDWPFHSWQKNYMVDSYIKKNNLIK